MFSYRLIKLQKKKEHSMTCKSNLNTSHISISIYYNILNVVRLTFWSLSYQCRTQMAKQDALPIVYVLVRVWQVYLLSIQLVLVNNNNIYRKELHWQHNLFAIDNTDDCFFDQVLSIIGCFPIIGSSQCLHSITFLKLY